jgi:acyl carrier protein
MTIIEKVISDWFKKKEKKLSINQNFIKSNIIDSFDLMELITFCEKYYDIRFREKDFNNEKFSSIKNISKIIKNHQK